MNRLRNQIDKLLQSSHPGATDDDALRMLVEIVARRDAIFYPWRVTTRDQAFLSNFPAIIALRDDYLSGARGIRASASGQLQWKDTHYTRRALIDRGLATAVTSKGQITGLFITEIGDQTAQILIDNGSTPVLDALPYLALLKKRRSLSESKLFQRELQGDPSEWSCLTERMLPLLTRGLVQSNSDSVGRVFYSYGFDDLPASVVIAEARQPWAFDAYLDSYNSERNALEQIQYAGTDLYIPLPPTGCGNCFCSPDTQ